jgi:hypothetical protein
MPRKRRQPQRPPLPRGFDCWKPDRYEIAAPVGGVELVDGLSYRGLGLHLNSATKAKYVRKDGTRRVYWSWAVTHLNTGHMVRGFYDVPIADVFAAATDLAMITDWTFDGLQGWRNTDPEVPDKLQAWHKRHQLGARQGGMGGNDDIAREIGMKRW